MQVGLGKTLQGWELRGEEVDSAYGRGLLWAGPGPLTCEPDWLRAWPGGGETLWGREGEAMLMSFPSRWACLGRSCSALRERQAKGPLQDGMLSPPEKATKNGSSKKPVCRSSDSFHTWS